MLKGGLRAWKLAGLATVQGAAAGGAPDGQLLYVRHCITCHQADGQGLPGSYPSLVGNSLVTNKDPSGLVWVSLAGLAPDQEVKTAKMPPLPDAITDAEVAALETYVRSQWGNHAPAVTTDQVHAVRARMPASTGGTSP